MGKAPCDTVTYVISIGLLCRGWWRRSVPGWGHSSCSGSEKPSSPTHGPSGGKDSSGSRRPSWYTNSNRPGCDSTPSPVSKRVTSAVFIIFSTIPQFTCIYTSGKSMFHISVRRNKEITCEVKTEANERLLSTRRKPSHLGSLSSSNRCNNIKETPRLNFWLKYWVGSYDIWEGCSH